MAVSTVTRALSSWVDLAPSSAHSGSRAIAGASFGSSSLEVDFENFVEIRVLAAGYKSIKVWVGAIDGGSARMLITDDLLAGNTLVDTAVTTDGFVEFTSTAGDIRRVLFTAGTDSSGIWIDDLSVDTAAAPPPPPPPPPPTSTVPVPASLTLLAPFAAGLLLRRRRQV